MFGKVMSIPDHLIMPYFELVTDVPDRELKEFRQELDAGSVNPMLLKKHLAREIVVQFHSVEAAQEAERHFTEVFQQRELPVEIPEFSPSSDDFSTEPIFVDSIGQWSLNIYDVLCSITNLVKSRSEARRLLSQGAVEVDSKKAMGSTLVVPPVSTIKVGKRRFARLNLRNLDREGKS
jgi:tyrosyl-tRNA synthetase